jgi:hypothetical protein
MERARFGFLLLASAAACQTPPPAAPANTAEPPPTTEPAVEEVGTATPSDAAEPAGAAGAPAAPPVASTEGTEHVTDLAVVAACKKLCSRVEKSCNEEATRRCRGVCKGYVEQADGCEEEFVAAIECQTTAAAAELCANVAASQCMDPFQQVKRCQRGEKAPTVTESKLPAGWKRITDDQLHFTVALPEGAALVSDAKLRTWRVQVGAVEYLAAQLPAPNQPITSKVLLRLVLDFVGFRCQKNLKMHGQFEIGDEVAILFDSACNDGLEWHGMLRARPDQAVATAFHAAPNSGGITDPFFYSYQRLSN